MPQSKTTLFIYLQLGYVFTFYLQYQGLIVLSVLEILSEKFNNQAI